MLVKPLQVTTWKDFVDRMTTVATTNEVTVINEVG
jgi:hypothetical protein